MAKKRIRRRLLGAYNLERKFLGHLSHHVLAGTKRLKPKQLAAFLIQNVAEGFARGLVQEARRKDRRH